MKKQNYLSASLILLLSLSCLIVGYWLGYEERQKLAKLIVSSIEREQTDRAEDTKDNLRMLIALQEGKTEIVGKLLTIKVKSGLIPVATTGDEAVDHLSGLGMPSEATMREALNYQMRYCTDKCLGL